MKLTIDTTEKTITLEQGIKLEEFIEAIEKLLPAEQWKDYTLLTTKNEININPQPMPWINPQPMYPVPGQPWYDNPYKITCCNKD